MRALLLALLAAALLGGCAARPCGTRLPAGTPGKEVEGQKGQRRWEALAAPRTYRRQSPPARRSRLQAAP